MDNSLLQKASASPDPERALAETTLVELYTGVYRSADPVAAERQLTAFLGTVTVLPLTPAQVVEVLCACAGKPMLAPGVIVGKDVLFWATVMRFAGALVARQQFLPEVEEIPHPHPGPLSEGKRSYRACWKPVFIGADADRLTKLARTMPQACRALTREAISPPERPVASVLSDFTCGLVDHLVGLVGGADEVEVAHRLAEAPERTGRREVVQVRRLLQRSHDGADDGNGGRDG